MPSEQLPINKHVLGLRAALAQPEEGTLTPLAFYLSHPSAAVKEPLPRAARFAAFLVVPVQLCHSVLWRRRRRRGAAGVLLKFLIAGTAGLWKCQEGSDREDLTNTWGLVDSLLSFCWGGGWM